MNLLVGQDSIGAPQEQLLHCLLFYIYRISGESSVFAFSYLPRYNYILYNSLLISSRGLLFVFGLVNSINSKEVTNKFMFLVVSVLSIISLIIYLPVIYQAIELKATQDFLLRFNVDINILVDQLSICLIISILGAIFFNEGKRETKSLLKILLGLNIILGILSIILILISPPDIYFNSYFIIITYINIIIGICSVIISLILHKNQ